LARALELAGFAVSPSSAEARTDIVQAVRLESEARLLAFCGAVQSASPVDSFVTPAPWNMPGYAHKVVMAAGAFVGGASLEISADAPLTPPYIAYAQGGLTYESGKRAVLAALGAVLS
jgi:cystathionine beta-lyase family protein involved in aluminum resistance